MKAPVAMFVALLAFAPSLEAQGGAIDAQCPNGTIAQRVAQDACQKALDVFTFLSPQLGLAVAGGNAVLGEHSSLRGPLRLSFGLRANAVRARVPRLDQVSVSTTGAVATEIPVEERIVAVPAIDAAIGLIRGFPIAGTNALGIDLLVNLAYIPDFEGDHVTLTTANGPFEVGFGARVSILEESFATPGISVTFLRRDLPPLDVTGMSGNDSLQVRSFEVQTTAIRAVVGKNFSVLGFVIGVGRDFYEMSGIGRVSIEEGGIRYAAGPITAVQDMARTNIFGSVSLRLGGFSIVGEVGRASGGTLTTYNSFSDGRADDAMKYASIGIRMQR